MALNLETNYKGITAEYWKILSVDSEVTQGKTRVILGLYFDEDSRNEDISNVLKREVFDFEVLDMTREQAYLAIKNESPFDASEDC